MLQMATRNVLNISLPAKMAAFVRREAKERQYASVSEFIRSLLREYEENRVLAELRQAQDDIRAGKGKVLLSLKDLE